MKSGKRIKNSKDYSQYPFANLSEENMKGEEWLDIPGFDGYYCVSNYGRIWAYSRPVQSSTGQLYYTKDQMRKQVLFKTYNRYSKEHREQLHVKLRYEKQSYMFLINRLVYSLFIHPINYEGDGLLIVHKDGDNCNNRADNLIAMNGTQLYCHDLDMERRPRVGRKLEKRKIITSILNAPCPVVQYKLGGKKVREYFSINDAAEQTGFHRGSIRASINKKIIQVHGYVFRVKGDRYKGENSDFSWEKPVVQYSIEGKKMQAFTSITAAASATGIDENSIGRSALKKKRLGSGFVWRTPDDSYHGEYAGKIENLPRRIVQVSLGGKKLAIFESFNQAAKFIKCTPGIIGDCAKKNAKVAKDLYGDLRATNITASLKLSHR